MAGTMFRGVNLQTHQVFLVNFQAALNSPLFERCSALAQLLQDAPLKDMQYIFSVVVENMFGFHTNADWGLLTLDKDLHRREFDALSKFLIPNGPIFRLVYKFLEEPAPKFEFPISCLPAPSQLMLQEGKIPPFYANKLLMNSTCVTSVHLSAFEFYFFHFSYFISNPSIKAATCNVNQQDTLYAHLLEDYLFHFLPLDSNTIPLYQPSTVPNSPAVQSPFGSPYSMAEKSHSFNLHSSSPARPDFLSPVKQTSSLLKKGTVLMVASPSGANSACSLTGSAPETWKSETLLLILKEFYLNQTSLDYQHNTLDILPKIFVPTHYHVWMVRILVKHLHFFSNSALSPNQTYGHGQIMIDSLGRLKSLGITQMIQKEMYSFLKSTFDHWPLDASFRVPLEAWLSYIQPLRYSQFDLDPNIWQKFVSQNLLFYTSILQQVLQRFFRMDLSFPKNAYMLFRVTKVFAMDHLREMILQAERNCHSANSKPSSVGLSSYLYPDKSYSFRQTSDFDVSSPGYSPLFSEPTFILVSDLLAAINAAREKSCFQIVNQSNTSTGIFSKIGSFFECSGDPYNSDDNSPVEVKKVESYLESSSEQLCKLFNEVTPPKPSFSSALDSNGVQSASIIRDNNNDGEFHYLSSIERIQLLNKKRKSSVSYRGNPDLQPVRTYEASFLVKLFSQISELFNEKYGPEIQQIYSSPTFLGRLSRQMLAKPVTYYNVIKSSDMQSVSWQAVHLPPRVNMRFLAHKQVWCYLIGLFFLNYFLGYHPMLVIILVTVISLLWLSVVVVLYPMPASVQPS